MDDHPTAEGHVFDGGSNGDLPFVLGGFGMMFGSLMTARRAAALAFLASIVTVAAATPPQYQIIDIGLAAAGDTASQGVRVSPNGIATGRSLHTGGANAFTWTQGGGIVSLPNLSSPARAFSVGNGVNNSGVVVGSGSTTAFGSGRIPLIWQGGTVAQLALPSGQTFGEANGINASGLAVGDVGSGVTQFGAIFQGNTASVITTTTANGSFFQTATGVNDSGLVVGQGIDPNNAAVNVGMVYNSVTNTATSVGALPGLNSALAFDVSNSGFVVGSSMLNQGSGTPYIWSAGGGISAIPLATGTSQGSAKGVNSSGMVVGTDSSAFAIPFLYDGTNTYRLGDLISAPGWDLLTNTSSSALSISDNGTIVGTGVLNGAVHAYAMVPVPEPAPFAALGLGVLVLARRRRR